MRVLAAALIVLLLPLVSSMPASAAPPPANPALPLPGDGRGPQPIGSVALVENSLSWDGREVLFTGEAVGEAMVRGEMAWIHLNDDAYMWRNLEEGAPLGGYNSGQAVWLPAADARRISFFGDYKHEGDVVTVRGTFNAACPEHGGDMDIHAHALVIEQAGHPVLHVANWRRALLAACLFLLSVILWLARRRAALRRI